MKSTLSIFRKQLWIIISAVFILSGCATVAPDAPQVKIPLKNRQTALNTVQNFQISGKIAVRTAQDAGSATVDWKQVKNHFDIALMGPLGANGLKLVGKPGAVTLTLSDGKHYTAATPEALLAERWGFHLPVSNMNYWIRGLPVPGAQASTHYDAYNRLSSIQQQEWDVQYLGFTRVNGIDLPSKMAINSPKLKVKIIIYQWKVLA